MKFYDFVYSDYGYDLSCFDKYTVHGSPEKGIIIIKFDENEVNDVFNRLFKSFFNPSNIDFNYFISQFVVFGDDGYIYKFIDGSLVKTDKKGFFSFWRSYCFALSRHRKFTSTNKRTLHFKNKYGTTVILNKPSICPYRSYEYYCKDQNIVFKYRLKKSRDSNKPLVVYMAGAGCLGYDNFKQLYECHTELHRHLKNYDCNIFIPQSPCSTNFAKPTSLQYIDAVRQLLDNICVDVKADRKRIYLIGTSYGGWCTWNMIYRSPDYFACGVPVMGTFDSISLKKDQINFDRLLSTPLWVAHSADDDNVRIDSDDYCVEKLKKLGVDVRYTRWEKYGHKMSSKFYKREPWAEWMFKQVKQ